MFYMGYMGFFGWIGMILFWGFFIWLVVWLIRKNDESNSILPLDIAKERYAKGELTKKQYKDLKTELEK